jgi:hypothetical protein
VIATTRSKIIDRRSSCHHQLIQATLFADRFRNTARTLHHGTIGCQRKDHTCPDSLPAVDNARHILRAPRLCWEVASRRKSIYIACHKDAKSIPETDMLTKMRATSKLDVKESSLPRITSGSDVKSWLFESIASLRTQVIHSTHISFRPNHRLNFDLPDLHRLMGKSH